MYGTVMIGTLKGTAEDLRLAAKEWQAERNVPGFVSSEALVSDDGTTIVNVVKFTDKAAYMALADDPAQDEWWTTKMRPLLAADPQWYDGEWES
jgi:antibiotic biosynthesis monooxygenase (ABM) superfamily enzyme